VVTPTRSRIAVAVGVAAIVVGVVFALRFFRGPDRHDYLSRNERVIAALPVPRGAHEKTREILRNEKTVFGEQLSHTVGYTTYVTYAVPPATTSKDVVRFYSRHLPSWQQKSWTVGRTLFACLARDDVTVSIQTDGLDHRFSAKTYGIGVDHHGGSCD
jgi:hypothetical protein